MICINLSHYQGKLATMQHVCLYFTYYKDIICKIVPVMKI